MGIELEPRRSKKSLVPLVKCNWEKFPHVVLIMVVSVINLHYDNVLKLPFLLLGIG